MTQKLHATLAQTNPIVGDIPFNLELIRKAVHKSPENTDMIVFPEMALCGYSPEDLVLDPFFMDHVEKTVAQIAEESTGHGKHLILPAPWRHEGKIYNAAHVIANGKILSTITKKTLPHYGVFNEARLFSPGLDYDPVTIKDTKIGIIICEDMWQPDTAARLKSRGAEMLIVCNASPYDREKHNMRRRIAAQRVSETGLPLLYVNLCGAQDDIIFDGASFALNETGALVFQAPEFVENSHHMLWEKAPGGQWLCQAENLVQPYTQTESMYCAAMTGLRDYVFKNGFSGVLVGLSGGIDSALSAAIAVDALGRDMVHCVMLPSRFTSKESTEDAQACARLLGVHYEVISIESAVKAFEATLSSHFTAHTPEIAHQNIQARCRGVILMALSNATGKMLLSTGNKSEIATGYATLYGDMCGGYNAIKDIYKTQIYELSRWRNENRPHHALGAQGAVMPDRILVKKPTAELKANQTDQDTLPPYETLDAILSCLIEENLEPDDIVNKGFERETVSSIWHMLNAAEYKRRQAPPGPKISSRALGSDRRFPITNNFYKTAL